jgi:hypothetical protein
MFFIIHGATAVKPNYGERERERERAHEHKKNSQITNKK